MEFINVYHQCVAHGFLLKQAPSPRNGWLICRLSGIQELHKVHTLGVALLHTL